MAFIFIINLKTMTTDVENNEWKAEAPYIAGLPKVNPFGVPEQYFSTNLSSLNAQIYLAGLKTENQSQGFTVPENYFEDLKDQIYFQTAGKHFLNDTLSQNGYNTPDNYFAKLQSNILAKTTEADVLVVVKETKIVRLWHSDLLKYASAACFILITAFGLYLNQQNFSQQSKTAEMSTELANEQMLYDIDEQDIIDHVQGNNVEEQQPAASQAEIESYILNNYSQNDLSSNL